MKAWFAVIKINKHLYTIRERLDLIEPRYQTKYTNMYLLLGEKYALLIDTGSGVESIKSIIDPLVEHRDLYVINSHNDFDHTLGNGEFETVSIHSSDVKSVEGTYDISFLEFTCKRYEEYDYKIPMTKNYNLLKGGEIFSLGNLSVEVIHTPGHTKGSICLKTDHGELFTGDTLHYGSMYIPRKAEIREFYESLETLENLVGIREIYPSHEEYGVSINMISEFKRILLNNYPFKLYPDDNREVEFIFREDEFLHSSVIECGSFNLIIPIED
jgi:glyoxylase-like metal-dependent hydrolase (beta-lactamase superfamily II)